jgi:hypothetical protein
MPKKLTILCAAATLVCAVLGGAPADAQPRIDRCDGVLHRKGDELWFGGGHGEGESICVIAPAQVGKVLAVCAVGRYCSVAGVGGDCEGSGECTEMKSVVAVSARKASGR